MNTLILRNIYVTTKTGKASKFNGFKTLTLWWCLLFILSCITLAQAMPNYQTSHRWSNNDTSQIKPTNEEQNNAIQSSQELLNGLIESTDHNGNVVQHTNQKEIASKQLSTRLDSDNNVNVNKEDHENLQNDMPQGMGDNMSTTSERPQLLYPCYFKVCNFIPRCVAYGTGC